MKKSELINILNKVEGDFDIKIAKDDLLGVKKDISDVTVNDEDEIITIYWKQP